MIAAGLVALAASLALAVGIGPAGVPIGDVAGIVAHRAGLAPAPAGVSPLQEAIVWDLRLPRALLAILVGAGLAVCGAVLQSLTRNPLTDPYLLGVSSGASTGAVLVLVAGVGSGALALSGGAFAGSAVAFALVLALAGRGAGRGDQRIVLAGIAGTQLFAALTAFVVIWSGDAQATRGVLYWLLGSTAAATWTSVAVCAAVLGAGLAVCAGHARALDAFAFGGDAAATLGVAVARVRVRLYVVTAAVTAALVAASGAIGFVGLVIPHAVRLVCGARHRALLAASAVGGALFLLWADTIARTAFAPRDLPVGIVTALVGVPAFALLLRRGRAAP
ncbi:MAG TPA: iron chelate uptake ABC transporter family permease subunit [Capillimicrobium sp.]|nr:iron chelate uptake ABC transporter family permease subunit [Capillimicrobium sp.]